MTQSGHGLTDMQSSIDSNVTSDVFLDRKVRIALDSILRHPKFESPDRSRRFLAYVVEEALAGRGDRIKAYTIATDVFGRGDDFDAHSDPIVRLEAGRLRRAIEQYYQGPGCEDPIVISIPKGGYVPQFHARPVVEAPEPEPRLALTPLRMALAGLAVVALAGLIASMVGGRPWGIAPAAPAVPRLLVRPFDAATGADAAVAVARGLTQEIIGQLAKFHDIVTVEGERDSSKDYGARYVLLGGVSVADDSLRLQARVLDAEDASVLWAKTYDTPFAPTRHIAAEAELARKVATEIGQPYGVIYQADAARTRQAASSDWDSYSCTLSYFTNRANRDALSHPRVHACLEETVARFPDYATAWALLAQTYLDELRFQYAVETTAAPASLERAGAAAKRAVELDPQNVRALQAQMLVLYFDGQVESALSIGERAMLTNPNDTELLGEYGARLAEAGHWSQGCPIVADATKRNPGPLGYYEVVLSMCAYIEEDYSRAATWIRRAAVIDNPAYHLIAAAVFAEAGLSMEAALEARWLQARAPDFVASVRQWVGVKNVPSVDRERFFRSLRKAGLPAIY